MESEDLRRKSREGEKVLKIHPLQRHAQGKGTRRRGPVSALLAGSLQPDKVLGAVEKGKATKGQAGWSS